MMINKEQVEKIVKTMQDLWVSEKTNLEKEIVKIVKPMYESYEANTRKSAFYGIDRKINIGNHGTYSWLSVITNSTILALRVRFQDSGAWINLSDKMELVIDDHEICNIMFNVGGFSINANGCRGAVSLIERYVYSTYLQCPDRLVQLKKGLPEFFKDVMRQFVEFFNAVSEEAEKVVQATIDAENKSDSMLLAEFGLESETKEAVRYPRYKIVEVKEKKGK